MHGIVHKTLEEYVTEETGVESWEAVLEEAGVESALYLSVSYYEDEDFFAVLESVASVEGRSEREIGRGVGHALAPTLLTTYRSYLKGTSSTMGVLRSLEEIREKVASSDDQLEIPVITIEETGPRTVELAYESDRGLCGLARGIVEGIATQNDESVDVEETACVHEGADHCTFAIESDTEPELGERIGH